jgi:hypothetical protein
VAKGNDIVVNGMFGKGRYTSFFNGTGGDLYPGSIVQIDPTVALRGGQHTVVFYNRDADGDQPKGDLILVTHEMQKTIGKLATDAIPSGEMFQGYSPLPGDDVNLLLADANTGTTTEDIAADTMLMVDDGTGKLVATTGSPEQEVAVTLEATNNMAAAALTWCRWANP